jgi:hypothetical protein
MPVSLTDIAAALQSHGTEHGLAAHQCPYVTDVNLGYVTTILSPLSAFIGAMVVIHEGTGLAFVPITDAEVATAVATFHDAVTAHVAVQRASGDTAASQTVVNAARKERDIAQHRSLIQSNISRHVAMNGYVDMVGCHQVKPLSTSNITQYFNMLRLNERDDDFREFVAYWALSNPGINRLQTFSIRVNAIEWTAYHSGVSSNAPLVLQANDTTPIDDFFTAAELESARQSKSSPGSMELARAIPKNALVKTYAILEAYGALPTNTWYMGLKAKEGFPAMKYQLLVKVIKSHQTLTTTVRIGDEHTTLPEMESNIRQLIREMDRGAATNNAGANDGHGGNGGGGGGGGGAGGGAGGGGGAGMAGGRGGGNAHGGGNDGNDGGNDDGGGNDGDGAGGGLSNANNDGVSVNNANDAGNVADDANDGLNADNAGARNNVRFGARLSNETDTGNAAKRNSGDVGKRGKAGGIHDVMRSERENGMDGDAGISGVEQKDAPDVISEEDLDRKPRAKDIISGSTKRKISEVFRAQNASKSGDDNDDEDDDEEDDETYDMLSGLDRAHGSVGKGADWDDDDDVEDGEVDSITSTMTPRRGVRHSARNKGAAKRAR